ncbi:hypothetical protein GCM10018779_58640 [Streptomyces griseocarneus]|nr:hypothetical protein GCM10018779_58640 [Streptomyces griseocarneus]
MSDLAEAVGMEASSCSRRLRLLRNLGLVTGERHGRSAVYALYDNHVAELLDQAPNHVEPLRVTSLPSCRSQLSPTDRAGFVRSYRGSLAVRSGWAVTTLRMVVCSVMPNTRISRSGSALSAASLRMWSWRRSPSVSRRGRTPRRSTKVTAGGPGRLRSSG